MRHARGVTAGAGLCALLAGIVVPTAVHAAGPCSPDWPTFQRDADRTGSTSCTSLSSTTVPTLVPAWFLPTSGAVTAEPAVVDGTAYVGDGSGLMQAIDLATGTERWAFDVTANPVDDDRHAASYGLITSSAAVSDVPSLGRTVFFGGGGTVYAVDAATGAPRWATDVDPGAPTSSAEVESSPVVLTRSSGNSIVFVGMDTNEDHGVDGGVLALNATTGAVLWKYDAETGTVVTPDPADPLWLSRAQGTGCGDVWSSPALDTSDRQHPRLFFGTGNCNADDSERVVALDADGGRTLWTFVEPSANHASDEDFGGAPVLTSVRGTDVVVQAGKSGWVYVLDRATGRPVLDPQGGRGAHAAVGSSIGGFIGAVSVAPGAGGDPVLYGSSAIPVHTDGTVDGMPDNDPTSMSSLHAVDLATGAVLWHAPAQSPSYAPTTVANDVVFAPDTTQFAVKAYDAATGVPLWQLPAGAAPSGGVTVVGDQVVFGVGTFFSGQLPPQVTGVWCFRPAA